MRRRSKLFRAIWLLLLIPGTAVSVPLAGGPNATKPAWTPAMGPPAPSDAGGGCLAQVPEPNLPIAPGIVHAGRLVSHNATRSVESDNTTVLAAMALLAATHENASLRDLTNWTERTTDICSFDLSSQTNLTLLAIFGIPWGALPERATVDLRFASECHHTVELAQGTALVAIALARTGAEVHAADVLTTTDGCRTQVTRDSTLEPGPIVPGHTLEATS